MIDSENIQLATARVSVRGTPGALIDMAIRDAAILALIEGRVVDLEFNKNTISIFPDHIITSIQREAERKETEYART